jgi:16S rRNA (guanine966-N2)-methyltransferase
VRVVAGTAGGLRLAAPPGRVTRPTTDFVRGAVFSALESMGAIAGASAYDLFAGSGAMGIEALSRGASAVTFVDDSRAAIDAIRANLASTGLGGATVVRSDAVQFAATAPAADLAFVDPPYRFDGWAAVLERRVASLVVLESARPLALPDEWEVVRERRYGGTVVTMARHAAAGAS